MEKIQEFFNYCRFIRNLSSETIKTYNVPLHDFDQYVDHRQDDQITYCDVLNYLTNITRRGDSPTTVNTYRAALNSYFKYLCLFHGLLVNPVARITKMKIEKKIPQCIDENILNDCIANMPESTRSEITAKTIIMMLYYCGLRISELRSIKISDLDFVNHVMTIHGKGSKIRIIPYSEKLDEYIEFLKIVNLKHKSDYIFTNNHYLPYTTNALRLIVKAALEDYVGQDLAHPHALRHSFATTLLRHHVPIETISKLLGHANLSTTMIYLTIPLSEISKSYHNVF